MYKYLLSAVAVTAVIAGSNGAFADQAAAQKWIDQEFQPSSLSKEEQLAEMDWFIAAAAPLAGRSEGRRVGKECLRSGRSRGAAEH